MKKEIPILYSTPMVQAILENRKTKTRRTKGLEIFSNSGLDYKFTHRGENLWSATANKSHWESEFKCPYGKVGDLLWVRETFSEDNDGVHIHYWYKADGEKQYPYNCKWTPSIHMPKTACRIYLEITDIRIERLYDITESDAIAEGVEVLSGKYKNYLFKKHGTDIEYYSSAVRSFRCLWQSINGLESRLLNPWVWVITFKRIAAPNEE